MLAIRVTMLASLMVGTLFARTHREETQYQIGVGIADITGPPAEVNMMGYAKPGQNSGGIHLRQYSRAFIVEDNRRNRVVYVSADICMMSQIVKLEVSKILKNKYNGLYTEANVMLAGTHTHSGPGGFLQYFLYIITAQGFIKQNFYAIVNGIVRSIDIAHSKMTPGFIYYNEGELHDASINRSPTAYANNPADEKAKYKDNTDKSIYQLKFTNLRQETLGLFTWFAVHPTSMNNTNSLISGDNKGYASLICEQRFNKGSLPGKGLVVCGFPNANLGDVSPNTKGPRCIDTGKTCDTVTSTCNGKNENCIASGPGDDMFESTKIIGEKQFTKAFELFNSASYQLSGPIAYAHQYVDMSNATVKLANGQTGKTCKPAMGYSFAAGTTDGPGAFDFKQGTTSTSTLWNIFRDVISKPTKELVECHKPKPILLATGQINFPYKWQPSIVPNQLFIIGDVAIAAVPAEFTTMSGRRLKATVGNVLGTHKVILSGLSNTYSSYVATFEEYQVQRYEGASTIYGPHTLEMYLQTFTKLANALKNNEPVESGPSPPNLLRDQISVHTPVIFDNAMNIGKTVADVKSCYRRGQTVSVRFHAGHPNNNLMTENSYLTVERLDESGTKWDIVATDANWETKFIWKRISTVMATSQVTIEWQITNETPFGKYRINHYGYYKPILQSPRPYSGQSSVFSVSESCYASSERGYSFM